MTFNSLEEARAHFDKDHFARENGVYLQEIREGFAECRMELTEHHQNALGQVMGGAIFTLADMCGGAAANSLHFPTVTQQINMNFLSPVQGKTLIARAGCRRSGQVSCIVQVDVTDELGTDVAACVWTGYKLSV